jgi:hypothetical protein
MWWRMAPRHSSGEWTGSQCLRHKSDFKKMQLWLWIVYECLRCGTSSALLIAELDCMLSLLCQLVDHPAVAVDTPAAADAPAILYTCFLP